MNRFAIAARAVLAIAFGNIGLVCFAGCAGESGLEDRNETEAEPVEQFLKDLPPQIHELRARPAEKDWLGDVHVTLDAYRNGHRVRGGEQRRHVLANGSAAPKTSRDLSAVTF